MGAACRAMCVRFLVFASFAIPASTASVDADASRVALRPVVPGQLRRGVGRLRGGSAGSIAAGSKVPCRFEVYAGALHQDDVVMLLGCGGGWSGVRRRPSSLNPPHRTNRGGQRRWSRQLERRFSTSLPFATEQDSCGGSRVITVSSSSQMSIARCCALSSRNTKSTSPLRREVVLRAFQAREPSCLVSKRAQLCSKDR